MIDTGSRVDDVGDHLRRSHLERALEEMETDPVLVRREAARLARDEVRGEAGIGAADVLREGGDGR